MGEGGEARYGGGSPVAFGYLQFFISPRVAYVWRIEAESAAPRPGRECSAHESTRGRALILRTTDRVRGRALIHPYRAARGVSPPVGFDIWGGARKGGCRGGETPAGGESAPLQKRAATYLQFFIDSLTRWVGGSERVVGYTSARGLCAYYAPVAWTCAAAG